MRYCGTKKQQTFGIIKNDEITMDATAACAHKLILWAEPNLIL